MADDISASVITLHQPRRAKTAAERARAYRERKKAMVPTTSQQREVVPAPANSSQQREEFLPPVTLLPAPADHVVHLDNVRPPRRSAAPILLTISALTLAVVGMTMNGWYARSLGSTESSGYLFLAIGVAADLVALVIPSCAAACWQARQRGTALAGWGVWMLTFVFAVTASIGFASLNISDVTMARSSRSTPAVTAAQTALNDAMASRDREFRGGVGKFCRERETAVAARRQAVETAMGAVAQTADPQAEAAILVVSWASLGALKPSGNDFEMLRLILLAMLPQIGGVVLMIGRANIFPAAGRSI